MPQAKHREPIVPAKVKRAVEVLLAQSRYDFVEAALAAGMAPYKLRDRLKRPEVLRYIRDQRRALIEEVCAGNPVALARVRDTSENGMAVCAAVRTSEAMRLATAVETGGGDVVRGLQIVIVQSSGQETVIGPPAAPMIEADPLMAEDAAELEHRRCGIPPARPPS
jgi:hypothetical protein